MKLEPSQVHAAIVNDAIPAFAGVDPNVAFGDFISTIVGAIIVVAALGTFLFILIGGLNWLSAGGDAKSLEGARNRITNGIIGLVIVVAAWAIMLLASQLLGFSFPNLQFPTLGGSTTQIAPNNSSGIGGGGGSSRTGSGTVPRPIPQP